MVASYVPPKAAARASLASRDDEAVPGLGDGFGEGGHETEISVADFSRAEILAKSRGDVGRDDALVDQNFHTTGRSAGFLGFPAPALQNPIVAELGVSVDQFV